MSDSASGDGLPAVAEPGGTGGLAALVQPVAIAPVKADDAALHRARRRLPDHPDQSVVCDHRRGNEGRHFCSGCGAALGPAAEASGPGEGHEPTADGRRRGPVARTIGRIRDGRPVRLLPFEAPPERSAPPEGALAAPAPPKPPAGTAVTRPAPPGPADALRAGLARPPKPRILLRWVLVGAAVVVVVLLVVFRSPLVNNVRTFLADLGIGRGRVYHRALVQSVWANQIVPGRSGRYVADGLATTYWAFNWTGPPPVGSLDDASVVLDLDGEHEIDQIGVSLGIQNGDAPFTANPRPRILLITVGDCPPAPASCASQQQSVRVSDTQTFKRYAIDIGQPGRRVTVQVTDVYPSLKSPSVPPAALDATTTTVAGQRTRPPPGLTAWAALTEVVLFERN